MTTNMSRVLVTPSARRDLSESKPNEYSSDVHIRADMTIIVDVKYIYTVHNVMSV